MIVDNKNGAQTVWIERDVIMHRHEFYETDVLLVIFIHTDSLIIPAFWSN